jgi:50S ribosome-binding GTPase
MYVYSLSKLNKEKKHRNQATSLQNQLETKPAQSREMVPPYLFRSPQQRRLLYSYLFQQRQLQLQQQQRVSSITVVQIYQRHNNNNRSLVLQQQKRYVSEQTFIRENTHISSAVRRMLEAAPDITLQVERINVVGCTNLLPYQVENAISNSILRIKVLTHVDTISEAALRHQLAYVEEQERLKYPPSKNKYPTAVVAVNLAVVEKQKELRLLQDAIFGATQLANNNQVWVCGSPNSGKSSLILPLTKNRTMTVRNKRAYHLPKISQRAGMTLGIKKHVMESNSSSSMFHIEATLHDMPGLRPRLEDPRTPAALMFAARVSETFPNYQELCHNDHILQLQLEACNRHEILTKQYTQYMNDAAEAAKGPSIQLNLNPPGKDMPPHALPPVFDEKNPLQDIEPAYVHRFQLQHGATNDPRIVRKAAQKVIPSCEDKKIMKFFHNFEGGGMIFTPTHKYHHLLVNHSTAMKFHFGSPIIYMNEAAVRLVDIHHGRARDFEPNKSSRLSDNEDDDVDEDDDDDDNSKNDDVLEDARNYGMK